MAEATILNKLRLKAGQRAIVIGAPESYRPVLDAVPAGIDLAERLEGDFDFIHYFATRQQALRELGPALKQHLKPKGILWVSYPKGKAIPTDLKREPVWEALESFGLQAVAQVAIDDVWSALRFKHRGE